MASLQVKYRPKSFKTFFGNDGVKKSLQEVLTREDKPHSLLFTGPSGCGKTTLARIVARTLGCKKVDYSELNSSNDRGIDAIRSLANQVQYAPLQGKVKVITLDEAHSITAPAQEALLKLIEEPPEHAYFCICTTNPESLKITLKRRCHQYTLSALKDSEIKKLLKVISKKEGIKPSKEVLDRIAEISDGSPGQALKLLDMVKEIADTKEALNVLQSSGTSESDVISICRALVQDLSPSSKWKKVSKLLKEFDGDPESARRIILGYLSKVLLNNGTIDIAIAMEAFLNPFYNTGKAGLILSCYQAIFEGTEE